VASQQVAAAARLEENMGLAERIRDHFVTNGEPD